MLAGRVKFWCFAVLIMGETLCLSEYDPHLRVYIS